MNNDTSSNNLSSQNENNNFSYQSNNTIPSVNNISNQTPNSKSNTNIQNNGNIYLNWKTPEEENNSNNQNEQITNATSNINSQNYTNYQNNRQDAQLFNSNIEITNNNLNQSQNVQNSSNNMFNAKINNIQSSFNNSINNTITSANIENHQLNDKITSKNIIKLILSFINCITIVPFIFEFGILWLIFGALGSKSIYYILLGGCSIYILLSIIIFIKNLWNVAKYNKKLKIIFIISIIFFLAFFIVVFNISKNDLKGVKRENNINENVVIFNNENINIKQKKIKYEINRVKVYFEINTPNITRFTLERYLSARVNKSNISGCELINEENDLYYLSIPNYELKEYNIDEIKKIDFNIYDNVEKKRFKY